MKYGVNAVNLLFPETDDSLIFMHHNETLIPIQSLLLNSESFLFALSKIDLLNFLPSQTP